MTRARRSGRQAFQALYRSFSGAGQVLVAVSFLAFASAPAQADPPGSMIQRLTAETLGFSNCASSATGATEVGAAFSVVADCVADRALAKVLDEAVNIAEDRGQTLLGEQFRIDNRLRLDAWRGGDGLSGELDAVVPLQMIPLAASGDEAERVFFLQTGVTRWMDGSGIRRNDLRHGLVHRFAAYDGLEHGVFGLWAFAQQNLERGHERLVAGVDYAGRWGAGSLSIFQPATGWRPGRAGYEERALQGMEFGLRIDATDTISLSGAAGRWEEFDGAAGWTTRARLGLEWRPHPWLHVRGNWTDMDAADRSLAARAAVTIPLGGTGRDRPKWRGLGLVGGDTAPGPSNLWRSVDSVGRIEVAERMVSAIASDTSQTVTLRFLQNSVDTGGTVRVEVALSSPASTETRLEVRLIPGSGDNPAVPGVDYVDETVEAVIAAGETTAEVTFRLLDNPSLETARSLSVTADVIV